MDQEITWSVVDGEAARLGATKAARLKWRQRKTGVPFGWRIKIATAIQARGETLDLNDFNRLPVKPGKLV